MDHLENAKMYVRQAESASCEWVAAHAQLATAHVLIAICERLPPPAEPWSERFKQLRKEGYAHPDDQEGD